MASTNAHTAAHVDSPSSDPPPSPRANPPNSTQHQQQHRQQSQPKHMQLHNDVHQQPLTSSAPSSSAFSTSSTTAASLSSFTILHPALASSAPPLTTPSVFALASTGVSIAQPKIVLPAETAIRDEKAQTHGPVAFQTMVVNAASTTTLTSTTTTTITSSSTTTATSPLSSPPSDMSTATVARPAASNFQQYPMIDSILDHTVQDHPSPPPCHQPQQQQQKHDTNSHSNPHDEQTSPHHPSSSMSAALPSLPISSIPSDMVGQQTLLERQPSDREPGSTLVSAPTISTASSDDDNLGVCSSDDVHPYFASAFDVQLHSSHGNSTLSADAQAPAGPRPEEEEKKKNGDDLDQIQQTATSMPTSFSTPTVIPPVVVQQSTPAPSKSSALSLVEEARQGGMDESHALDNNTVSKTAALGFAPLQDNGQVGSRAVVATPAAAATVVSGGGAVLGRASTPVFDMENNDNGDLGEDEDSDSDDSSGAPPSETLKADVGCSVGTHRQQRRKRTSTSSASSDMSALDDHRRLSNPPIAAMAAAALAADQEAGGTEPRINRDAAAVASHVRAGIAPALTLDPLRTTSPMANGLAPQGSNLGLRQEGNEAEMEALIEKKDWSQTPLGPRESWPLELQMIMQLILRSESPLAFYWGEECTLVYNDAWRPILKQKHPLSLGMPGAEVWAEIWDVLSAQMAEIRRTGRGVDNKGMRLDLHREGYQEECYFDFTFSPIFVQGGKVGGILAFVQEVTKSILSQRRLKTLNQFSKQATTIQSEIGAYSMIAETLHEANNPDVTFSILYQAKEISKDHPTILDDNFSALHTPIPSSCLDPQYGAMDPGADSFTTFSPCPTMPRSLLTSGSFSSPAIGKSSKDSRRVPQTAILCATSFDRNLQEVESGGEKEMVFVKGISTRHIPDSLLITPEEYEPLDPTGPIYDDPWAWPVRSVLADGVPRLVTLPKSTHKLARALVLPILENPSMLESRITTVLIVGINPYQMLDNEYLDFLTLMVGNIGSLLHFGRVRENERKNAQALFELNKAKISFFQNVSHELRTPLTLMLAPLEDVIAETPAGSKTRPSLEMIQRNTRRLLKLVNTLLQFSRIEAGRNHAMFEETDLAKYTRDISANFESVAHGFNLDFKVECLPLDTLPGGVWVDQAMWSGIVLNLLGNAFKHTWKGSVTVRQYPCNGPGGKPGVALEVADTGVGIASEHLHTLFGRFNRIENKQSRSHEGTGIGLSLVKELTEIHGGTVSVTSKLDVGSTFRLWIPAGREHFPASQVKLGDSDDFECDETQPRLLDNKTDPSMFVEEASQWIAQKAIPGSTISASGTDSAEEEKIDEYHERLLWGIDPFATNGSTAVGELPDRDDYEVSKMDVDETEFSKLLIEPSSDLRKFHMIEYLPPSKSSYNDVNDDEGDQSGILARKTHPPTRQSLMPKSKVRRGFVVIVDDNNDMRAYLREILGKEFRVRCAVDGLDALRLIRERHQEGKRIDLILSDVAMPNMNGYELLAKLRADPQTMATPFILLSARAGEEANVEGLDRGADDCMVKPFSARELLARVRSSIRLSDLRRELIREQRHALELKQLIYSISVRIRSGLSLPQILDTASRELFKAIRCNAIRICRFRSVDPETKQHWVRFVSEIVRTGKPKIMSHAEHLLPQGLQVSEEGLSDLLLEQDTELKQVNNYHHPVYGAKSFISVALLYNRKIWGYLIASRDADMEDWSQSEKLLFEQTATQISLAIAHASLWEQKKLQQVEVEAALAANEAKSQILANTSHELRTPIGAIVGALSALEDTDYNLTGEQRDMVKIMQITSDVALSVINDLLDTAKLESGTMSLCIKDCPSLLETLEQSVRIFADKAGRKEVDLIMEPFEDRDGLEGIIRSGQQVIWTDGDRLQQVIMNLIGNAVKFTSVGKVVIQCSLEKSDAPVPPSTPSSVKSSKMNADSSTNNSESESGSHHRQHHRQQQRSTSTLASTNGTSSLSTYWQQQAKYLSHRSVPLPPGSEVTYATIRFEVTDTGIGIDPEFLKNHIFKSFAQVDQTMTRRFGGTGLGLAISKHLVMMNGGSLGVTSDVGQGSVFYFTWPIMLVRQKDTAGTSLPSSSASSSSLSAMLTHSLTSCMAPTLSAETAATMRAVVVEPVSEARNFLAWILHQQAVVTTDYDNIEQMLKDERKRTLDLCDTDGSVLVSNYRPHAQFFFSVKTSTAEATLFAAGQLVEILKERNRQRYQLCEELRQGDMHEQADALEQSLVLSIVLVVFSSPQGRALAKELVRKIKRLAPASELTIRCRYVLKPVKVDRILECFQYGGGKAGKDSQGGGGNRAQLHHSNNVTAFSTTAVMEASSGSQPEAGNADATAALPIQADLEVLRAPYPHIHSACALQHQQKQKQLQQQQQQQQRQHRKGALTRAEFLESGEYEQASACNRNTPELARTPSKVYTPDDGVFWATGGGGGSQPPQHHVSSSSHHQSRHLPHQHHHHQGSSSSRRTRFAAGSAPSSPTRGLGLTIGVASGDDDSQPEGSPMHSHHGLKENSRPLTPPGRGTDYTSPTGAAGGVGSYFDNASSDSTSTIAFRRRTWNRKVKAGRSSTTTSTEDSGAASPPATCSSMGGILSGMMMTPAATIPEVEGGGTAPSSSSSSSKSVAISKTATTAQVAFSSRTARAAAGKRERRGKTVLCVEDNIINLRVVQYQLEKLGYDTKAAPDGQVAVDMIKEQVVALGELSAQGGALMEQLNQVLAAQQALESGEPVANSSADPSAMQKQGLKTAAEEDAKSSQQPSLAASTEAVAQVGQDGETVGVTVATAIPSNVKYTPTNSGTATPRRLTTTQPARPSAISSAVLDSLVDTIPAVSYQRHGELSSDPDAGGTDTEEASETQMEATATAADAKNALVNSAGARPSPVQVATLSEAELSALDASTPAPLPTQVVNGSIQSKKQGAGASEQDPLSAMMSAMSTMPNGGSHATGDQAVATMVMGSPSSNVERASTPAAAGMESLAVTDNTNSGHNSDHMRMMSRSTSWDRRNHHGSQQQHQKIDLILMDCAMPVKSGFEAAYEIRQMGQHSPYAASVPIIALTASAVPSTKEKCLAAGMNGYLSKPTKLKDLENMLDQWLQK